MTEEIFQRIALTAIAPEIERLNDVTQQNIPSNVKEVCKSLIESLEEQADHVIDLLDMQILRSRLQVVSIFSKLVVNASPQRSSWWAQPLIQECYRVCRITEKRDVLIIHTNGYIASSYIDSFSVYPNIFSFLQIAGLGVSTADVPLDIYVIPTEVRFDISYIAVIGHEVGHVCWQVRRDILIEKAQQRIKEESLTNAGKYIQQDLLKQRKEEVNAKRVALHIEEYLCDQVGRYLLGPAFDFALLKYFATLNENKGSSRTHPPKDKRIQWSLDYICSYVTNENKCAPYIQKMREKIQSMGAKISPSSTEVHLDKYDEIAEEVTNDVYRSSGLIISEHISSGKLSQLWANVRTELDGFRPPFETVDGDKPIAITPIEAIIGTTLYFHGEAYKEKNQFYVGNSKPENERRSILFEKLIEHLRYSISLYDFVRFSHKNMSFFSDGNSENTLWQWRQKTVKGEPDPFIVTPTIDPENQYGQSTVDLRLGSSFLVNQPSRYTHINPAPSDTSLPDYYKTVHVPVSEKFVLHPHQFVLASILEYICLPSDFYALVLGRSSWGRLGLNIATATTVQSGFRGCLTLELRNLGESPLPLTVGARIAQLCLIRVPSQSTSQGYFQSKGKYIGPVKAEVPRIHHDPDWELLESFFKSKFRS